ncbi:MAG TPA: hypothetical protein VK928_07020 [Longimicrobiales bacterium]|nr:hypothetical protein [Longimicrobiales bacterium]
MAQIVVRNIDDDVMRSFRRRAEAQGTSAEQAVRDLIEAAAREHEAWGVFANRSMQLRERLRGTGYAVGDVAADTRSDRER